METWKDKINPKIIDWLLEEDKVNTPVKFLTLRDIIEKPDGDTDLEQAREAIMACGPIPAILKKQRPEGYWENGENIYLPKYFSTVWQVIFLAQMGANSEHPQIQKACEFILKHSIGKFGGFGTDGNRSGAVHCLQGNLSAALMVFGFRNDSRLLTAMDWMARSVTGESFTAAGEKDSKDYYIRSAICGPGFQCAANDHHPCAWGAIKVALAFSHVPPEQRTPSEKEAVEYCKKFLLSADPAAAEYPHPYAKTASQSWFKFGFPVFYVTDVLQNLEVLIGLGLQGDERLRNAMDLVLKKQDKNGRWVMEYSYNGKTWVAIEEKGKASKWVTLRAVRAIKNFFR